MTGLSTEQLLAELIKRNRDGDWSHKINMAGADSHSAKLEIQSGHGCEIATIEIYSDKLEWLENLEGKK